jgi:hypothetical protein
MDREQDFRQRRQSASPFSTRCELKIVNEELQRRIKQGEKIKLELGPGGPASPGFFGIDSVALPGVDVVGDLNEPWTAIPTGCVEEVYTRHTLEHLPNLLGVMREIHRVCSPDARIQIIVPHYSNVYAMSDPTHVRFFGLYTMYYFADPAEQPWRKVPAFYSDTRFHVDRIFIAFYRNSRLERWFVALFERLVNWRFWTQECYERRLSFLFHAWEIRYTLRPARPVPTLTSTDQT